MKLTVIGSDQSVVSMRIDVTFDSVKLIGWAYSVAN